ncbi:MAG: hypothetical protein QM784_01590 [Polyangiaceae bacterium]
MKPAETNYPSSMAPPHRRQLKNYLLLKDFQLKYAAMFAGTALALSLLLGALLTKTSHDVLKQSQEAVEQGRRAVETGQQLVLESQKVSAVVGLSLVKSTDYSDHPELNEAFARDNQALASKTQERQRTLERQASSLAANANALRRQQTSVLAIIFGGLSVLVVALGILGIVFTHKVAGPVFKMKRYLSRIRQGQLIEPAPLRKGDELKDFFDELCTTIRALRERERDDLMLLEAAAKSLDGKDPELQERLQVRCELKRRAIAD